MNRSFLVGDTVTWDSTAQKTHKEAIALYINELGAGPTYTVTKLIDVDTSQEATKSTQYFFIQVNNLPINFCPNWFQRTN